MTEKPETWAEYMQIVGRSNRLDYRGEKKAALLIHKNLTQAGVEQSLKAEEINVKGASEMKESERENEKELKIPEDI